MPRTSEGWFKTILEPSKWSFFFVNKHVKWPEKEHFCIILQCL